MIRSLSPRGLALVLLTLPALAGCSAATFAGIRPAPAVVASNMPPPQAQAVLSLEEPPSVIW